MKYISIILFIVLVSSCTQETPEITNTTNNTEEVAVTEQSVSELDDVVSSISEGAWTELVSVDATYTNPKWNVDMLIEYTLDADGKITDISTSATTYDLSKFNTKINTVVGKTVEEASEMYFSGSSLTTEAFQKAMKTQIK